MSSRESGNQQLLKIQRIDDLLQRNLWDVDHRPHIVVDTSRCTDCEYKPCVLLCPAGCYTLVDSKLLFSYEGCLECGTCRTVCPREAITWNYPVSGRGVLYRFS